MQQPIRCGALIAHSLRARHIPSATTVVHQQLLYREISSTTHGKRQTNFTTDKKVTPLGWFLLLIPVGTFGLGCWQVERKKWKENLMKELNNLTNMAPIELPDNLNELNAMEYRTVRLRGKFLHDKELLMGPRSFLKSGDATSKGGLFSGQDSGIGFLVITPFKLDGRAETVLINRGWVPKQCVDASHRLAGQVKGYIDLEAVVRRGEARPNFTPESRGKTYLYRDLDRMCAQTGADPYFLDAAVETTIAGGPVGGQTRVTLRNEHLSYIATWFSLSLLSSAMWYRQIFKRIPF